MNSAEVFAAGDMKGLFVPVQLDKLPKIVLKVYMCCNKCEEIVAELRDIQGVVQVKIDRENSKVTVIGNPSPSRVLRKARKVDKKAEFWVETKQEKEKAKKEEEPAKKKAEESSAQKDPEYQPSQAYPARHYPEYPQTDHSRFLIENPHYLKHIIS